MMYIRRLRPRCQWVQVSFSNSPAIDAIHNSTCIHFSVWLFLRLSNQTRGEFNFFLFLSFTSGAERRKRVAYISAADVYRDHERDAINIQMCRTKRFRDVFGFWRGMYLVPWIWKHCKCRIDTSSGSGRRFSCFLFESFIYFRVFASSPSSSPFVSPCVLNRFPSSFSFCSSIGATHLASASARTRGVSLCNCVFVFRRAVDRSVSAVTIPLSFGCITTHYAVSIYIIIINIQIRCNLNYRI